MKEREYLPLNGMLASFDSLIDQACRDDRVSGGYAPDVKLRFRRYIAYSLRVMAKESSFFSHHDASNDFPDWLREYARDIDRFAAQDVPF